MTIMCKWNMGSSLASLCQVLLRLLQFPPTNATPRCMFCRNEGADVMQRSDHGSPIHVHAADLDGTDIPQPAFSLGKEQAEIRISSRRNTLELVVRAHFLCGYGTKHDGENPEFVAVVQLNQDEFLARVEEITAALGAE